MSLLPITKIMYKDQHYLKHFLIPRVEHIHKFKYGDSDVNVDSEEVKDIEGGEETENIKHQLENLKRYK